MITVGIAEARNRLSDLVDRAARGEEIVITRCGEQVARVMPFQPPAALGQAGTLAARIRQSRGQAVGRGASIRNLTEEDRR